MGGVLEEIGITLPGYGVLFYVRQCLDGKIEFISGWNDVEKLSPEFKEQLIEFVQEHFNCFSKDVKK